MNRIAPLFVALGLLACLQALHAAAAEAPVDVRTMMSPDEFRAAGLETLTPAQIDALNAWLMRYTVVEAPVLRQQNAAVREEARRIEAVETTSEIAGSFIGWSGKTVFRLANGQVWQQRMSGSWRHRAESPAVVVRKNVLGFWELEVVGTGKRIGVRRVE